MTEEEERKELAKRSRDSRLLDRLSRDEKSWIREAVAENPNTPPEILDQLSRDESDWVRMRVAKNPNTPVETLDQLSRHNGYGVSEAVVENPKWKAIEESGLLDVAILASKWLNIL